MGKYILHSVKYFVKLLALLAFIYLLTYLTGTLGITLAELFGKRGALLLAAMVVLSAAYPSFGFISRTVKADAEEDREAILESFRLCGYTLRSDEDGRMRFTASSPLKRIWYLGDDAVTVTSAGKGSIIISGNRKEVVQAEFRIASRTQYK